MIAKFKAKRQTKSAIKKIAKEFELVNFGNVDPKESEHPIKGFTFFPSTEDRNVHHGNVGGLDLTLAQREAYLEFPKHNQGSYEWTIVRGELENIKFPHIFIDSGRYDKVVYKNIFTKFARFSQNNHLLAEGDFKNNFNIFCAPDNANLINDLFPDNILEYIYYNFAKFDIEFEQNAIYVYHNNLIVDYMTLKKMIEELQFLANHFYQL